MRWFSPIVWRHFHRACILEQTATRVSYHLPGGEREERMGALRPTGSRNAIAISPDRPSRGAYFACLRTAPARSRDDRRHGTAPLRVARRNELRPARWTCQPESFQGLLRLPPEPAVAAGRIWARYVCLPELVWRRKNGHVPIFGACVMQATTGIELRRTARNNVRPKERSGSSRSQVEGRGFRSRDHRGIR